MAETFGEADVILRARLDRLQQDLDDAERMTRAQTERIANEQRVIVQQVQTQQANGRTMGDAAVELGKLYLIKQAIERRWQLIAGIMRGVVGLVQRIASAMMGVVGAVMVLPVVLGDIIRMVRGIPDTLARIREALQHITLQGIVEQTGLLLLRLPIIGGLFRGLGRTISEVSELLGGPNFMAQIEQAERAIEIAHQNMRNLADAADIAGDSFTRLRDMARQLEQSVERLGTEGVGAAMVAGLHDAENALRGFDREIADVGRRFMEETRGIWEGAQDRLGRGAFSRVATRDDLTEEEARRLATMEAQRNRNLEQLNQQRERAARALQQLARARVEDAREQERLQRMRDTTEVERLTFGIEIAGVDDQFEQQRLRLEQQRRQTMREAIVAGNEDRLGLIEDYYDARARLVDQREREAMEQQSRLQEEAAMREQTAMARLQSQIAQAQLRIMGENIAAQEEAIRQQFQEMIDQAEQAGSGQRANLLRLLRDLRVFELGQQRQEGMVGRGLDVTRDRIAFGEERARTMEVEAPEFGQMVGHLAKIRMRLERQEAPG